MTIRSFTLALLAGASAAAGAQAQELNLYSSRHYDTDEALYQNFTAQTGIEINRIEAPADELIERMKAEGANSPADVLLTVDAGRLFRAAQEGLLRPVESAVLEQRVPDNLQHSDNLWFGFSQRARVIYLNPERVDPRAVQSYQDLASEAVAGEVCIRSSSNIYNLSLMAALIEHLGEQGAQAWAEDVVANFARPPQGNDTAQIRAVASGECGVSLGNTYYLARLIASDDAADQQVVENVEVVFPNQDTTGTHVNISGGGVAANAPNRAAAVRFLEYLVSDEAQRYLANGNNEYAVVEGVTLDNPALAQMGEFETDDLNLSLLGENQAQAVKLYDAAGWQ